MNDWEQKPGFFSHNRLATGTRMIPPTLRETSPQAKRVIWALDPFASHESFITHTASLLASLQLAEWGTDIYPVYVLSEESFAERGFSDALRPALKPMARKALHEIVDEVGFLRLRKPTVLVERSASRVRCAKKLLRFARRIHAHSIAIGSQPRGGLSRLLAGHFSEALIENSSLPLFLSGPQMHPTRSKPRAVVFPTDFSAASEKALTDVLALAQSLKAEIHLFHKTVHLIDPLLQSGVSMLGGGWISAEAFLHDRTDDHVQDTARWIREAQIAGVPLRYMSENFHEPTSEAILKYLQALDGSSMIVAIAAQSGPLASALLGSVTRDLIRHSPCPIFLVPRARTASV